MDLYQKAIERGLEIMRLSPLSYHNVHHVEEILTELQRLPISNELRALVSVIAAFHDAVYVPSASDNEIRSAALFRAEFGGEFPSEIEKQIVAGILATAASVERHNAAEQQLMHDLDYAAFRSEERLLRASRQIRGEYQNLSVDEFWTGRCAFLESVLRHGPVFESEFFQTENAAAQAAILGVIARIKDGSAALTE